MYLTKQIKTIGAALEYNCPYIVVYSTHLGYDARKIIKIGLKNLKKKDCD